MVKLVCLRCGQVWYSAYPGGTCEYCQGRLVEASDAGDSPVKPDKVVSLSFKRAMRKLTR